jgi:hypothetical protein
MIGHRADEKHPTSLISTYHGHPQKQSKIPLNPSHSHNIFSLKPNELTYSERCLRCIL